MRTLTAWPSLILPLVLGISACQCPADATPDAGAVDAGPPTLTEVEPNDGADTALSIEVSAFVDANLSADPKAPDVDWYALKAALPRTADVTATCPAGADVALEVVDEVGTVLSRVNAGGPGQDERLVNVDVSGRVLVRVVSVKKGAGGAYRLQVTFRDRMPGFELEPNDRSVDATLVPLGQAVSGFIGHGDDIDWYRFELPSDEATDGMAPEAEDAGDASPAPPPPAEGSLEDAGASPAAAPADAGAPPERRLALRVDISAVEGVAFDLQVLTEAEAALFSAKSRDGVGLSLRNVGVRAADRIIYVAIRSLTQGTGKDARRGANLDTYYTLSVGPEENGGSAELEPNDEAARATPLPPNAFREGFISPAGDSDFFRLDTVGPSIVTAELSGVDKVDLQLSLVRAVEGKPDEVVLKVNEGGVREGERLNNVFCDGACFLKVDTVARKVGKQWARVDENGDQAYRLLATVVPDDGSAEREPNDSAASASPVEFNKPVRGTVYPTKDVDYFRVDLSARPVKTPLVARLLGTLKVDVALYLHRVEDDGKLTLVQTSDTAKGDKAELVKASVEPGVYVLEVRDVRNRQSNFQDSYQLTVEEGTE